MHCLIQLATFQPSGLVRIQTAARLSGYELVSVTIFGRLRGCFEALRAPPPVRVMALPSLFCARHHTERCGLYEASVRFAFYSSLNTTPRSCPYQSGARMLSGPYAVSGLKGAT
jgi:hypothetical protein